MTKFRFLFGIAIIGTFYSFCQEVKIIPIYENEQYQLNSGGNAALMGGRSRTYIPIDLPDNTVGIIYVVRTSVSLDGNESIKLAAVITSAVTGQMALSKAIESIPLPKSNGVVDAFLLPYDQQNLNMFLNKQDARWTQYTDYSCVSSIGCKRSVKLSENDPRKFYLGLRNPSGVSRIIVVVDVVALVK
jgi:hypothetical protein